VEVTPENYLEELSRSIDGFFDAIKQRDAKRCSSFFEKQVFVKYESVNVSNYEIQETIIGWLDKTREINIPKYSKKIDKIDEDKYLVVINFEKDIDLFLPSIDKNLILKFFRSDGKFLIYEVDKKQTEKTLTQNGSPKNVITDMVESLIKGDIENAIDYFYNDVWFDEYGMILSKSAIYKNFQAWIGQNPEIQTVEEVIDTGTIKPFDDKNARIFKNWQITSDEFDKITFQVISKSVFPLNPNKKNCVFIMDRSDIDSKYKILGIGQY